MDYKIKNKSIILKSNLKNNSRYYLINSLNQERFKEIPYGTLSLHFYNINEDIGEYLKLIPNTIIELSFGDNFDSIISYIPFFIKKIEFGGIFNKKLDFLKNSNINIIKIYGGIFNQDIDNLPLTIKKIQIIGIFNKTLDNLPNELEELIINSDNFNIPINKFPDLLKTFILRSQLFNHKINNFNDKLEFLFIGDIYNHSLNNLPNSLKYLRLSDRYNLPIDDLNENIKELNLGFGYNEFINKLPKNLRELRISTNFGSDKMRCNLPINLEKINLCNSHYYLLKEEDIINCCNLKVLKINNKYNIDFLDNIINKKENYEKLLIFCQNIKELSFGRCYDYKIDDFIFLFENLEILHINSYNYNNTINNLPHNLKKIYFEGSFNNSIDNLPDSITHIEFLNCEFNQHINKLPKNLIYIIGDRDYKLLIKCEYNNIIFFMNNKMYDNSYYSIYLNITKLLEINDYIIDKNIFYKEYCEKIYNPNNLIKYKLFDLIYEDCF